MPVREGPRAMPQNNNHGWQLRISLRTTARHWNRPAVQTGKSKIRAARHVRNTAASPGTSSLAVNQRKIPNAARLSPMTTIRMKLRTSMTGTDPRTNGNERRKEIITIRVIPIGTNGSRARVAGERRNRAAKRTCFGIAKGQQDMVEIRVTT